MEFVGIVGPSCTGMLLFEALDCVNIACTPHTILRSLLQHVGRVQLGSKS